MIDFINSVVASILQKLIIRILENWERVKPVYEQIKRFLIPSLIKILFLFFLLISLIIYQDFNHEMQSDNEIFSRLSEGERYFFEVSFNKRYGSRVFSIGMDEKNGEIFKVIDLEKTIGNNKRNIYRWFYHRFIQDKYSSSQAKENSQKKSFLLSFEKFEQSLREIPNDPESRIYSNNATIKHRFDKIKTIAVVAPIYKNKAVAEEILRGAAQAQTEILKKYEECNTCTFPINLLIVNDDNNPNIAKKLARHLIEDRNDVIAVVGHNASSVSNVVYEQYQGKLVMLSPTSYAFDHQKIKEQKTNYIYTLARQLDELLPAIGNLINPEQKIKKKKILFCHDSKAHDNELFKKNFDKKGIDVVIQPKEKNKSADTSVLCDFETLNDSVLETARSEGIKDLFLSSHVNNITDSLIMAYKSEKDFKLYSTSTLYTKDTLELGKDAIEGLTLTVDWHFESHKKNSCFIKNALGIWDPAVSKPEMNKLVDIYRISDIDITWRTVLTYDAIGLIMNKLKDYETSDITRNVLQQELSGGKEYSGVTGDIKFEANGRRLRDERELLVYVSQDENKKYVFKTNESKYKNLRMIAQECEESGNK